MIINTHSLKKHQGAAAIVVAAAAGLILTLSAFAVDIGNVYASEVAIQNAVDAATRAGIVQITNRNLEGDPAEAALAEARKIFYKNKIFGRELSPTNVSLDIELGRWDAEAQVFTADNAEAPTAMRIFAQSTGQYTFAKLFGWDTFTVEGEAIATLGLAPRDIALTIDLSNSMNDDSELSVQSGSAKRNFPFSQAESEAHLFQLYEEMKAIETVDGLSADYPDGYPYLQDDDNDSDTTHPYYGKLQFDCQDIAYSSNSSNQTIAEDLDLYYWDGTYTFEGTSAIKNWVYRPFPFLGHDPDDHWNSYIDYIRSSSELNTGQYNYNYCFSYMTLIHYLLRNYPSAEQTPGLYHLSAQPLHAVKEAIYTFLDLVAGSSSGSSSPTSLGISESDDRVALIIFNYTDGLGYIEHPLGYSDHFPHIKDIIRKRQAGHYSNGTNMAAGLDSALEALNTSCNSTSPKPITNRQQKIILVSDGEPIVYTPNHDNKARKETLDKARVAAACNIEIDTISLGGAADHDFMQEIADITGGAHIIIDGGLSVEEYTLLLDDSFSTFALSNTGKDYAFVK